MGGRLTRILVILSLLLSIASAAMWVHSTVYYAWIGYTRPPRMFGLESKLGCLRLSYHRDYREYGARFTRKPGWVCRCFEGKYTERGLPGLLGFSLHSGDAYTLESAIARTPPFGFVAELTVPYWAVAAASLIFPIVWWLKQRKRCKYVEQGRCAHCGYDLRASKDRCPECGTPIPIHRSAISAT